MRQRIYTVYMATCSANGKSYIGFDSKWPARKYGHEQQARLGCRYKFHRAIKKYGPESFAWEALYQSKDGLHCLNVMEPHFIAERGSYFGGYNMTLGGDGNLGRKASPETLAKMLGRKHSQETLDKMRRSAVGRKLSLETKMKLKFANSGRVHSLESKAKMSAANRGRVFTQEHKAKIRVSILGQKRSEEARANMSAWTRTPEARAKMSAAASERRASPAARISMSAAQKTSRIGRKHSAEARANMKESALRRWRSPARNDSQEQHTVHMAATPGDRSTLKCDGEEN